MRSVLLLQRRDLSAQRASGSMQAVAANSHDHEPFLFFWFLVFLAPHRRMERLERSPT
jgi:hypothetical protein